MSTAAAFKYPRAFPFCVTDLSSVLPTFSVPTYTGNLTLAEVMAFAWNLETFTITTTGTATSNSLTADGGGYFTLSPIASDRMDHAGLEDQSLWFDATVGSEVAFASFPNILKPRSRVCARTSTLLNIDSTILFLYVRDNLSSIVAQLEIGFWLSTDPSNSGKYRIYFLMGFVYKDPTTSTVALTFSDRTAGGGETNITSGTMTIGGISFPWYANKTSGVSHSGVGFSVTSTSFTY